MSDPREYSASIIRQGYETDKRCCVPPLRSTDCRQTPRIWRASSASNSALLTSLSYEVLLILYRSSKFKGGSRATVSIDSGETGSSGRSSLTSRESNLESHQSSMFSTKLFLSSSRKSQSKVTDYTYITLLRGLHLGRPFGTLPALSWQYSERHGHFGLLL